MTIIDWSRGVYLLFAEENGVAGEDDAEGDAAGGTKSSISGEGRARSSSRRIRWDVTPPDLNGR